MANKLKAVKKGLNRIKKQLDSDNGLTLHSTFDVNTSLYSHGKDGAPHVSLWAKGDYKISILKLALILVGAAMICAAVAVSIRAVARKLREPKPRPRKPKRTTDEIYHDEEIGV